ncbi:hypothetical protein D3C84_232820 [compost metagenome]
MKTLLVFRKANQGLRDGLSAVVQIGDTLWVANDETLSLERLALVDRAGAKGLEYAEHETFPLEPLLALPVVPRAGKGLVEADIEGLDHDSAKGYLWLVGSHSLKRKKPDSDKSLGKNIERLANVGSDGNRYLLARLPVVEQDGSFTLVRGATEDGRTAAQLQGDQSGNELTQALKDDKHLKDFLHIPGKDNGFDIEGLAVVGERLFIGLRGPVLRGWSIILELEPKDAPDAPHTFSLGKIGPQGRPYRKHFLQLGGLGIRDLCVQGDDLLILAGPTMDLDGPVTVMRWPNGARPPGESLVFNEQLCKVLDVPYGQGADHAEGMTLLQVKAMHEPSLLVVYDAAAEGRKQGESAVKVDVFQLPASE